MHLLGHGIDITQVSRIASMRAEHKDHFLTRCFTQLELDHANASRKAGLDEHLAGRFAAKEAVLKALGTGWSGGIKWTDVEIIPTASGPPQIKLHDEAARIASNMGITSWSLSISHAAGIAIASALALADQG